MKLPWKRKAELEEKIDELQDRVEKIEGEKESWRKRFEAEKERRSDLSRKKQEAEKELNRLKQKLEEEEKEEDSEDQEEELVFEELDFREAKKTLRKIGSLESDKRELVTVYVPRRPENLSDLKSLKNSIDKGTYSMLQGRESFIAFIDPELGAFILEMSPFFDERVEVAESFQVDELLDFLESGKHWALVSAGETTVYREEGGEVEEIDRIKSRVEKEHSKGGFSQGRFERKRDEQIENHLEKTKQLLEGYEEVLVLGDRRFCEDLPAEYLGGFDPNQSRPEQFYRFRLAAVF